jgi:histidinol phosphatase-like enzyme (inositol monophosphatase family)
MSSSADAAPPLDSLSSERMAELEDFILELNGAASAVSLPLFRTGLGIEDKRGRGQFDPVTEADRGAERAIRALIAQRYPDHGVLGEEYGADRADAEFVWVLDPVDGTRAFVAGLPTWCTLIGLRHHGRPVLGLIGQPYIGEVFVGSQAGGSKLIRGGHQAPLRVRPCPLLTEATIAATDPHAYFNGAELGAWNQVRAAARNVRLGGDAYLFAMAAMGTIDLVIESNLHPWDIEPAIPIIQGAGGFVCNWRGETVSPLAGQVVAGGDRACLDEALVALKRSAA